MASRPTVLTPEIVIADYSPMLYKLIRSFHIADVEEGDLFNDIILAFITPSKKIGTTYLERYSPARGAVSTYLYLHAHHILKSQYRKAKKRSRMVPAEKDEKPGVAEWYKTTLTESQRHAEEGQLEASLERHQILKALRSHGHRSGRHCCGPRRSTRRASLHLLKGESMTEIAQHMGMTPVAVRRKLQSLKTDPMLTAIAEDRGIARSG